MKLDACASRPTRHDPALDGLRGVACLIVLVGHSLVTSIPETRDVLRGVPKIGVWCFFVLSAFLLTTRLLDAPLRPAAVADYVVARIVRIVPLFLLAVGLYRIMGILDMDEVGGAMRVATMREGVGHLWTIPVETTFYIVLPFLVASLSILPTLAWRLLALATISVASAVAWPPGQTPLNSVSLVWYLGTFLAGVAAALVSRSLRGPLSAWTAPVAVAAIMALVFGSKTFGDDLSGVLVAMHWAFAIPFATLILALRHGDGTMRRTLSWRPLVLVGHWSYSIYLFHIVFVVPLAEVPATIGVPVGIVASIATGWVCHAWLELPLARVRTAAASRSAVLVRSREPVARAAAI